MRSFERLTLSALGLLVATVASIAFLPMRAFAEEEGGPPSSGTIHIVLFGKDDHALSDVVVALGPHRHRTSAHGAASFAAPSGASTLTLIVPRPLVPLAPAGAGDWEVELPQVPVIAGETTEVIVTLEADGTVRSVDIQAAAAASSDKSALGLATATAATQAVRGRVVAAEGGAPIEGAHVYVRGTSTESVSDAGGNFTLALPPGSHFLSVIHQKFSVQSARVEVASEGPTPEVRIALSPASVELEELVVTVPYIEGGIASVAAEERETSSIADVLGAEQMSKAGDSSAASALTRVTGLTIVGGKFIYVRGMGDRYSSTLLNGLRVPSPEPDVRVVPLDLFPAGLLESVLVQKGYSADLPGDFGGGVVALRTKGYPDELTVSGSIGIGANSATTFRTAPIYRGGSRDWLGFDDGGRALPSDVAAIPRLDEASVLSPEGLSPDQINDLGRQFDNRWKLGSKRLLPDGDASLVIGNSFNLGEHVRWGFSAAGLYSHEWRLVRDAQNALYNVQGSSQRTTRSDTTQREVLLGGMLDGGATFYKDHKLRLTTMLLRQSTDETFHIKEGFWGEVDSDFRQTRFAFVERQLFSQQVSLENVVRRLNDLKLEWKYAFSMASRNEPNHLEALYWRAGDQYQLYTRSGSNLRFFSDLNDTLHDARFDLTQPFPVWSSLEAKLKAGAALFKQQRDVGTRRFSINATAATVENLRMPPEVILGPDMIGVPGGTTFSEGTLPADPYTGEVKGLAGYGTLELPLSRQIALMAGARAENYEIVATTIEQRTRVSTFDVLPSGSLTVQVVDSLQLRGSFAQTVNRPDLRELVPSQFTDVQTGVTKRGNPDLKSAQIRHYDARLEWYLSGDESFSVGGFYKTFDNPIELQLQGGATPTQTWSNARGATNGGLEVEGRKRLDFLSERLSDMYVGGNVAWIKSKVELGEGSIATNRTRPLAGQSPWVINVQLGYDDPGSGLNASVLYNVSGARIDSVGVMGLDDVMEQPFHQLDIVVGKQLKHGFRLSGKARNVLNGSRRFTQGDQLFAQYRRGTDLSIDLTWNL